MARDAATLAVLGEYTYDAFGRRVRKIAGGATTLFFYGPSPHLVEEQVPAGSPATARTYVYLEDEPAGVVDQAAGGTPAFSWVHGDQLTTPRAVTSAPASGGAAVVWRAVHAPFGLTVTTEDPDGDLQSFALDLRFPGQQFDAESGLHYALLRSFDAATGRYLESEPLGQVRGVNPFGIPRNNPFTGTGALFAQADIDHLLEASGPPSPILTFLTRSGRYRCREPLPASPTPSLLGEVSGSMTDSWRSWTAKV